MTTDPVETVDVIQADRDRAADYVAERHGDDLLAEMIRKGEADGCYTVDAFARHRTAHTSPVMDEEVRGMVERLRASSRHALEGNWTNQTSRRLLEAADLIERLAASGGGG